MYANVHFRPSGEAAFIPDDFLGTGDRNKRAREEAMSQQAAMRANAALAKIRRGEPTEYVPAWAIGEYKGTMSGRSHSQSSAKS